MIRPVGVEVFFDRHWEQQFLHVPRQAPDYYSHALTVEDVERYFQSQHLSPRFIRVVKDGSACPPDQWVWADRGRGATAFPIVDIPRLLALFDSGATVIVNCAESAMPSVADLTGALGHEWRCSVQANVYLTPPGAQGFAPHFDTHDVFVLQAHGHKQWTLYDSPVDSPVHQRPVDTVEYGGRIGGEQVDLRQGDLLYIPRGTVHAARTADTASIHVTVGIMIDHRSRLLRSLAERADQRPAFRRLLPHGLSSREAREAFSAAFTSEVRTLLEETDLTAMSEALLTQDRRPALGGRLTDLLTAPLLTPEAVVRCRPWQSPVIERTEQWIILKTGSGELSLPVQLATAVDMLLAGQPVVVREIAGISGTGGQVSLATRLVRSGILTIVSL